MVINSRLLSLGWRPADPVAPDAVAPPGLRLHADRHVVLTQYVVDTAIQTSGLGAHSVTLLGIDLDVAGDPTRVPPRLWVAAYASTQQAQEFFASRGIPTQIGRTAIEFRGESVVATTTVGESPIVRVAARVGAPTLVEAGDRAYVRQDGDGLVEEVHPWIATLADGWALTSLELLEPAGAFAALRPREPVEAVWGFYSPNASFCYPGAGRPVVATPPPAWGGAFAES